MSGNTESVTESVKGSTKGSVTGSGGTSDVAGREVTGAEAADVTGAAGASGAAGGSAAGAGEGRAGGARGGAVKAGGGAQDGGQRPAGIGPRLARAREAAGLSVAELSRLTRIREPVIHAIEHDDFSITGGDFYARGHIRNIARVVGLDPEAIVHEYDDQHGGVPIPVRAAEVFLAEIPIKLRERRNFNWTTAMAVVLIMVVAFGAARMMSGPGEVDSLRQGATPAARPAGPSGTPANAAPSPRPAASATALAAVVLRVTADRSTRLVVRDGQGKRLFRGRFQAGSSSEWRARGRIDVTADDAGAVRLEVNGKDLGPAGRAGERLTRSFGPSSSGVR